MAAEEEDGARTTTRRGGEEVVLACSFAQYQSRFAISLGGREQFGVGAPSAR